MVVEREYETELIYSQIKWRDTIPLIKKSERKKIRFN